MLKKHNARFEIDFLCEILLLEFILLILCFCFFSVLFTLIFSFIPPGERVLKETDIPLLERLMLGPSDSVKIFIRDTPETTPIVVNPAHIPDGSSPTTETPPEDTPLPEEVCTLHVQLPWLYCLFASHSHTIGSY